MPPWNTTNTGWWPSFSSPFDPQNNFLVMDSCQDASCNQWCCGPRNVTQDLYLLTNYCQNWNDLLDHRRQNAKSTAERLVQIVELLLLTGTKATLKFDSHRLWWWWCWCWEGWHTHDHDDDDDDEEDDEADDDEDDEVDKLWFLF